MTHVTGRLINRVRPYHIAIAQRLINSASETRFNTDTAIVAKVDRAFCADGSNGDNLVLIVRNNTPVTLMYSRQGQINTAHLRVSEIVRLS